LENKSVVLIRVHSWFESTAQKQQILRGANTRVELFEKLVLHVEHARIARPGGGIGTEAGIVGLQVAAQGVLTLLVAQAGQRVFEETLRPGIQRIGTV